MLLSVDRLRIHYATSAGDLKAVDGVSFDIGEGEVIALVGESGSGKTTLARAILNLLPRSAYVAGGSITFRDMNMLEMSTDELCQVRGKQIGMIFQEPVSYLDPLMKVGQQLAETLETHEHLSGNQSAMEVKAIMKKVRIADVDRVYDYYPHQLSGGMAQRVGIGIAISCNPRLLIADEPTSSLDVTVQAQILHLLKQLGRDLNLSILLITHDLGVVSGMADRVIIMYAGRIAEEANVYEIFKSPRHPYTKALLGASRLPQEGIARTVPEGSLPDLTNLPSGCRYRERCPHSKAKCLMDPPEFRCSAKSRVYCWLYGESDE